MMVNYPPQAVELNFKETIPLSLYIHIPWCIKKCPYCDFNSHQINNKTIAEEQYINALIIDLESSLPLIWGRSITSIFIGGGTPSLFSAQAIDNLMAQIRARVRLSPYAEITIEANPGALEIKNVLAYQQSGINRISLGIQSFDDKKLQILGRIHSAKEAIKAIEIVSTHYNNFNLDLMYGLPQQSIKEALTDLNLAASFNPQHISCYNLTIEPHTEFFRQQPAHLPTIDQCYDMGIALIDQLKTYNYLRYEISAFAQKGYNSKHNSNYWLFGDYLGIGAGAHSKITYNNSIIRQVREKHPDHYINKIKDLTQVRENYPVKNKDIALEFMLNSLRLTQGFTLNLFTKHTGLPLNTILTQLLQAQVDGFIILSDTMVIPTAKGQDFLNELLLYFMEI